MSSALIIGSSEKALDMLVLVLSLVCLTSVGTCLEADVFYRFLKNTKSNDSECETQKQIFLDGLSEREEWALKMLDSFGRIPQLITQGNYIDFGAYDQCVKVSETFEVATIDGKFCLGGLILPLNSVIDIILPPGETSNGSEITRGIESYPSMLFLSACIPSACLPSDFFGVYGTDTQCITKEDRKQLDAGDISFIVFSSIILLFMAISTIYDIYLQKYSKEAIHKTLLAFSLCTNGEKMFKTSKQTGQILFFNGMKVLSMFWIIMGHRYEVSFYNVMNKEDIQEWKTYWYSSLMLLYGLAVDTFFFISGALLAYTFLKSMRKPNAKLNIPLYYLHRYLRLTPAMVMVFFFHLTIARRMVILLQALEPTYTDCQNNWWSFLLYIQNYVARNEQCLFHTWYLSVDMQLYILSPVLLLPLLFYGKRMTYIGMPVLIVFAIAANMLQIYIFKSTDNNTAFSNMQQYTHSKFPQWLIGIMFGAFMLDYQKDRAMYQIKNKAIVVTLWAANFVIMAAVLLGNDDVSNNETTAKATFYYALQKPAWALCLAWVSFACMNGNGEIINKFLSLPLFQVLSKITYSTYLVHMTLLVMHYGQIRVGVYFAEYDMLREAISDVIVAYAVGAIWTLAFEYPVGILEEATFGPGGGKGVKKENKATRDISATEKGNISGTIATE